MHPRKLISAALAAALSLAATTPAFAAVKPTKAPAYSYELTKVDSFKGERSGVDFYKGAALRMDGDEAYLIGTDGKDILDDQPITYVQYLTDGIYIVGIDKSDSKEAKEDEMAAVNNMGIVNEDGEVLLPFEAALISYETDSAADANFLRVCYATETTDERSECLVYSSDNQFSLTPGEDDTMYKGYSEVFSLDKERIVKGVKITNNDSRALRDLDDSFTVHEDDGFTMYDASGKQLWKSEAGNVTVYDNAVVTYHNSEYHIIDEEGEERYATKDTINSLTGPNGYFRQKGMDDDEYTIIDIDGKQVLAQTYDKVNYEAGGMFDVGEGSDEAVVDAQGNTIVSETTGALTEVIDGYCVTKADDEYVLIASGKQVASGTDGNYSDLMIYEKDGDDHTYLVLNEGKFSLTLKSANKVGLGLASARTSDEAYTYGLYDLFTGKQLLDDDYERIERCGDYVYAYTDGTWTVYELDLED